MTVREFVQQLIDGDFEIDAELFVNVTDKEGEGVREIGSLKLDPGMIYIRTGKKIT